jgi:hypothetical protein
LPLSARALIKKRRGYRRTIHVYFFGFSEAFALTCFIGSSQHMIWHPSPQSHGFSTNTTRPHSSHSYCSPFFLAKKSPSKSSYTASLFKKYKNYCSNVAWAEVQTIAVS